MSSILWIQSTDNSVVDTLLTTEFLSSHLCHVWVWVCIVCTFHVFHTYSSLQQTIDINGNTFVIDSTIKDIRIEHKQKTNDNWNMSQVEWCAAPDSTQFNSATFFANKPLMAVIANINLITVLPLTNVHVFHSFTA